MDRHSQSDKWWCASSETVWWRCGCERTVLLKAWGQSMPTNFQKAIPSGFARI